jgi:hypothetical protein
VYFNTPGTYGTFDQTTFEADLAASITAICQLQADALGQTLAEVQTGITVTRQWGWSNGSGGSAGYSDTMTYPPAE